MVVSSPVVDLIDNCGVFSSPLSRWCPISELGRLGRIYTGLVGDQAEKIARGDDFAKFPASASAIGSQAGISLIPLAWLAIAKWIGAWVSMDGRIHAIPALEVGGRMGEWAPAADRERLNTLLHPPSILDLAPYADCSRLTWLICGLGEWHGLEIDPASWRIVDGPKHQPAGCVLGAGAWFAVADKVGAGR